MIGHAKKASGYRDVAVQAAGSVIRCETYKTDDGWRLTRRERGNPCEQVVEVTVPRVMVEGAVWEWCKVGSTGSDASSLCRTDERKWGLYTEEVNAQLERAFQAKERECKIEVCSREYVAQFTANSSYARQIDQAHDKERLVRRSRTCMFNF